MGQIPSMAAPTSLATYIDERNSTTCSDMISEEECQRIVLNSKWHDWYYADIIYAQGATYFFATGLALFTLFNVWYLIRHRLKRSHVRAISNDPMQIWMSGLKGYLNSRQFRLNKYFGYSLTLGETAIVCIMILFFSALTLGPQPYYWPNTMDYGYSPPIATRAGFLAIAILPFQVMFATKFNPITILTGVSHEKLQIYHRWSGWIMYVLALIHTFPFIIVNIEMGMMVEYWHTDFYTFSGVICLFPQTALVLLSIGSIRDRYYETFKSLHFVMAAWFIVLLFLHCGFTLTSAYYFVGFAVTYTLSLLVRLGIVIRNGLQHRADIQVLDNEMLSVEIPTRLKWKPGQHYFFRFFTGNIHALTSHPFTVASTPDPKGDSLVRLYIKKHKGMTHDLFDGANVANIRVLLDGPYGGVAGDLGVYDRLLLIAGGTGGSFLTGALADLVHRQDGILCSAITVIYSCRRRSEGSVFHSLVLEAAAKSKIDIDVVFHVSSALDTANEITGGDKIAALVPEGPQETSLDAKDLLNNVSIFRNGRANLPGHIERVTAERGTVGIIVCGPKEMASDVRNAVARQQLKIIAGSIGCSELYLHTEAFGW